MSEPQKVIDISTGSTSPESKQLFQLEPPPPEPTPKKRQRKAKQPKPSPEPNLLLAAAQFISVTQPKRSTNPVESYCRIFGKHISACAGVLSAGIKIQEDIECCPHTQKFLDALTECPDTINLTLLPTKELSIKSGNFHAIVPCVEQSELPAIYSDLNDIPVSIEFEQALQRVGKIANEHNRTVLYSSVQMLQGSIIATNGDVIMEAWHGCTTPFGLIVPKMFIKALHRTKGKAVYSLACTADTLTAYYPDRSWIKTKLHHDEHFPNLQGFLNLPVQLEFVPLGFWAAVERLAPFSNDDRIYLRKEGMCTDRYETDGAINTCEGLPDGISFAISTLRLIQPFAEKIAFNVTRSMSYFQGKNIRGVIAQRPIQV
jgi:hypothetical protein